MGYFTASSQDNVCLAAAPVQLDDAMFSLLYSSLLPVLLVPVFSIVLAMTLFSVLPLGIRMCYSVVG